MLANTADSYPSPLLPDPSNATISRAIFYNPDPEAIYLDDVARFGPDLQIDSFVYPYWQGNGVKPGVEFSCPTGIV